MIPPCLATAAGRGQKRDHKQGFDDKTKLRTAEFCARSLSRIFPMSGTRLCLVSRETATETIARARCCPPWPLLGYDGASFRMVKNGIASKFLSKGVTNEK
jgi:hypothetical protein